MDMIRVLIADDHAIVREGIRLILNSDPDIEVVGEAMDGYDTLDKTNVLDPDVVLMDITMPGMSGLDATRLLKEKNPDVKVLVLTMHESNEYFFEILDAGAAGYVIKGCSPGELISAIQAVGRGDVFLYPSMAKKLLNDYMNRVRSRQDTDSNDVLTKRERQIARLIAEGRSNREIADILLISARTVQTHRNRIMVKLGLHSRTELVKYAIRRGFVALDT